MSASVTIKIGAVQWLGEGDPLPEGCHFCQPEVHWSADRTAIYFTYADLWSRHWITSAELSEQPEAPFMGGVFVVTRDDMSKYYRQAYPFNCWSIKSEASVKGDHRALFVDRSDEEMVRRLTDYMYVESWTNPLPPRAEFREKSGAYGRGYRPHYLSPGDWLLDAPLADGNRTMTDAKFQKMRA